MKCVINLMGFQRFDKGTQPNKNISLKKYVLAIT